MKILLTGAGGYMGSHIAKRLAGNGYEVYGILRNTSAVPASLKNIKKIYRYEYSGQLYEIVREIQPEMVIHTAGMFLGEHTGENIQQLLNSNIVFTAVLTDAANQAGCRCMIQTGSYWQNYCGREYDPVNLYAATKQAAEDILEYYKNAYQWKILTLRIFDVFGPGDQRKKVLNLVRDLKEGETLDLTYGEQKLYMCYIDDVVSAYMQAVHLVREQNPGSGRRYAVRGKKAWTDICYILSVRTVTHYLHSAPHKGSMTRLRPQEESMPAAVLPHRASVQDPEIRTTYRQPDFPYRPARFPPHRPAEQAE